MDLLEREHHLAQLDSHLQSAAAGRGRVVMVGGEAGAGKTTLLQQFHDSLGEHCAVLRASCDTMSTPAPMGPARDLAPALGVVVDLDGDGDRARDTLFRAVYEALAARELPTVIIGEDAHWADGVSLAWLRFLARRIGDLRLLFVVTYRDDELGPTHPLRVTLGDLATMPTVHRMQVPPLSFDAVSRLAAGAGREPAWLHQLTGGNPFFVSEVLAAPESIVPATVTDAVLARAARLPGEARAVLDVAAVISVQIDLDLLLAVAGPVSDAIDRCIMAGLLAIDGSRIRFRHALTRAAVLEAIPPLRRRLLHARVLNALRERKTELALLAHHAEAAGDQPAVLEFAIAAAKEATAMHAHWEAAAQYARALRFAGTLSAADQAALYEAHADACYLSDQGQEAIASRLAAIDLRRQLGDRPREGDNLRWLSRHYWFFGRGDDAERAGLEAIQILEELPPGRALSMAYSNLAQLRMLADDNGAALSWGERALALAEEVGDKETEIHALCNVGTARRRHDLARSREELERSVTLAIAGGFPDHAGRALTNLSWGEVEQMDLAAASERIARALAFTHDRALDGYGSYLLAMRALAEAHAGDWDEGLADGAEVLKRPRLSPLARMVALTARGRIHARRGDAAAAAAALDEALALAKPTGQILRLGPIYAARAEAALLASDDDHTIAEVMAILPLAKERGFPMLTGELAWLLQEAGDASRPFDDLAPPYAMQIAGDWAEAAAAWQALGCRYNAAVARTRSDDITAIRVGIETLDEMGAQPALRRAIAHLREQGVDDLPAMRRGPRRSTQANPAGLTQREAEVLRLLMAGLRNAEIADRLYLTPKTVSHHLSAIYAKLGVTNRAEATALAAKHGMFGEQSGDGPATNLGISPDAVMA